MNDGVHNCMPPSNADEPNKPFPDWSQSANQQNAGNQPTQYQPPPPQNTNNNHKTGAATHIHVEHTIFYLITITAFIFAVMF